jgi:hypothetical protein
MPELSPRGLQIAPPAARLAADGLVPLGVPLPPEPPTDTVDARAFQHPAMPGRVVVRLVPDVMAEGVGLEMARMGFSLSGHADDIALRRRQALRYPATALLIDPARAHLALDRMDRFRAEAARAATKPGHARDGFTALAAELEGLAPRFLPGFWEEAGRAFLDQGNLAIAASCFDKARMAERAHGLPVDPAVQADAWLEFALAGALTVKALQAHGKELAATGPAGFHRYLDLCVRRTLGGLPPWSGMLAELRRAAKAAKLPASACDEALLRALVGSRALARAPASMWTELRPALVTLCRADAELRARLAAVLPEPNGDTDGFEALWLSLLDETGVLQHLVDVGPPEGSLAAWVSRFANPWRHNPAFAALVRRLAPALRAAGEGLQIFEEAWSGADADLLDLCIELGVPVAPPAEGDEAPSTVDLDAWASGADDDDDDDEDGGAAAEGAAAVAPRRDLSRVAAHPLWGPVLLASVPQVRRAARFHAVARGLPHLAGVRESSALALFADLPARPLKALRARLTFVEHGAYDLLQSEFPAVRAGLEGIDVAAALAHTLHCGLLAELAWPSWEAAAAELGAGEEDVELHGTAAHPMLSNSRELRVLGPDGEVLRMDLVPHGDHTADHFAYADGQVFGGWWSYPKPGGAWSGDPGRVVEVAALPQSGRITGAPGPTGGLCYGGREIKAGDSRFEHVAEVLTDGAAIWVVEGAAFHRLDPATGARSPGAPPGLEGSDASSARLAPAAGSPWPALFGGADGLDRWRVDRPAGGDALPARFTAADGRSVTRDQPDQVEPEALLRWPGAEVDLPVTLSWRGEVHLHSADLRHSVGESDEQPWAAGWGLVPPFPLWVYLRPRDPAGSAALRVADGALAADLIAAAVAHPEDPAALRAAVAARVPAVTAPALIEALCAQARAAVEAQEVVRAVLHGAAAAAEAPEEAPPVAPDGELSDLWDRISLPTDGESGDLGRALLDAGRFFAAARAGDGGPAPTPTPTNLRWEQVGEAWRALVLPASAAADGPRLAAAALLEAWADSGLHAGGGVGPLRRVKLWHAGPQHPFIQTHPNRWSEEPEADPLWTRALGDHRYLCRAVQEDDDDGWEIEAIEQAGADGFAVPDGLRLMEEHPVPLPASAEALRAGAAALRAGRRAVAPADVAALAAATGLPGPAACLLLWGWPRGNRWQNDRLGPELRGQMGLKLAEVKLAMEALQPLESPVPAGAGDAGASIEAALYAAACPPEQPDLVQISGAVVPALAAAHRRLLGARVSIPEELLKAALAAGDDARSLLDLLLNPPQRPRWAVAAASGLGPGGLDSAGPPDAVWLDADALQVVARGLPWLLHATPHGDPVRARVLELLDEARAALASPHHCVQVGGVYSYDEKGMAQVRALYDAFPAPERRIGGDDDDPIFGKDDGHVAMWRHGRWIEAGLRPAHGVDGPRVRGVLGFDHDLALNALVNRALLLSDGLRALAARAVDPAVPAGWDQDPRRSAPAVVAAAQARHGLDADAAALYLQVLALPDPTRKRVLEWNGWKPAQYARAEAPLLEKGLLTAGKRPRAGREHFLPGAWLTRAAPDLPLEGWKLPLYELEVAGLRGVPTEPMAPSEPCGALFGRAWARVEAGDAPRLGDA